MDKKNHLKVGFIGLGLMGNPMAKNLLKKGFLSGVYNRSEKRLEEFKKLNVKVYNSPKELAQESDVLISMVTGPKDVEEILLGKNGIKDSNKKGLIIIDMGTIGPEAAISISKKVKKYGIDFADAPVTGSVPKAITGELTIFVGAEKSVFKKIKPILAAMGTNIQYMGITGKGQAIKLVNNLILAICAVGLAEGMLLADKLSLSRQKAIETLWDSPALSPYMKMKSRNMVENDYKPIFSMVNMYKDLNLALNESKKGKINLPVLKLIENLYKTGIKKGYKDLDLSAILKVISG